VEADDQHASLCTARLSGAALQLMEASVTAADWLANFRVTTKLQESYEVVKSAFRILIRHFYDSVTAS